MSNPMTNKTTPDDSAIEQLFLDRILLIDTIKHFGIGMEDDEREGFILLGTPAELIAAINAKITELLVEELIKIPTEISNWGDNPLPINKIGVKLEPFTSQAIMGTIHNYGDIIRKRVAQLQASQPITAKQKEME